MNRTTRLAIPAVILLAVLGWAGYQYFIVADAPDQVSTDAALEQLTRDLAEETEGTAEEPATPDGDTAPTSPDEAAPAATNLVVDDANEVTGSWSVDDDFGSFAFENASGSFAGFRVDKELFVGGQQVAVGRSGDITGSVTITDNTVTGVEVVVVTTTIQSDISMRESAIADAVRADEFPTATFVSTEPTAVDTAALAAGETVSAVLTGELTIAGVSNAVSVVAEATVAEAGLALIVGTADLVWADFGVETPNSNAGTVADEGVLEFQLIVRHTGAAVASDAADEVAQPLEDDAPEQGPRPGAGGGGGAVVPASIETEAELVDLIGGHAACGDGSLDLHRGHLPIEMTLETLLGISHDQMHVYMEDDDMNLAAVADQTGLGADQLADALIDFFTPAVDGLLDAGTITADQASLYRGNLETAVSFRVNWDGAESPPAFCTAAQ